MPTHLTHHQATDNINTYASWQQPVAAHANVTSGSEQLQAQHPANSGQTAMQQQGMTGSRQFLSSLSGIALEPNFQREQQQQQSRSQQAPFLNNASPADSVPFIQYGADIMGDDRNVRNWVYQHSESQRLQAQAIQAAQTNRAYQAASMPSPHPLQSQQHQLLAQQQYPQAQQPQQQQQLLTAAQPTQGGVSSLYTTTHHMAGQYQQQQGSGILPSLAAPTSFGAGGGGGAESEMIAMRSEMSSMRQQIEVMGRAAAAAAFVPPPESSYAGSIAGEGSTTATKKKNAFSQLFSRKPSKKKNV